MKAITIKQPWASLIVEGVKDIENRTWATKYRGRVLIHAGLYKCKDPQHILTGKQIIDVWEQQKGLEIFGSHLIHGAIIGSVEIVDCVINNTSVWADKSQLYENPDDNWLYFDHPTYNWVLANPIKFDEPILNVKGKLSFWEYKTE